MFLNLSTQHFDHLLATLEGHRLHEFQDALVGELLLLTVFGLVESVGIDEQRAVGDICYLFALVIEFGNDSHGGVRFHINEFGFAITQEYGRIVACITEVQMTSLEIEQAQEHRHEHTRLVVLARQGVVDARGNLSRFHLLSCQRTEQSCGLSHKQ